MTNIYNKVVGLALAALTFTACSDEWDDHYSAPTASDGMTIWQTIEMDQANLSNFAKVLKATGYDKALASSQVFTVFAPVNAQFTEADANEIIDLYEQQKAANIKDRDNRAIKEFVHNHLALYNYSTSGKADSITMMNGKYLLMTDNKLANSTMLTKNQLKSNGVMFTMEEPVDFFPNVFEYMSVDEDIDSIGKFMSQYNQYDFNASESVPGGIIDGKTWYLDSQKTVPTGWWLPPTKYGMSWCPSTSLTSTTTVRWRSATHWLTPNPVWHCSEERCSAVLATPMLLSMTLCFRSTLRSTPTVHIRT